MLKLRKVSSELESRKTEEICAHTAVRKMVNILPLNHWLFQVASLFFCLSYIQGGIFYLRICLLIATTCLALWAWFILNVAIDTFSWNLLQSVINIVMLGFLFWEKVPITFDPITEEVYARVFATVCSRENHSWPVRRDAKMLRSDCLCVGAHRSGTRQQ